MTFLALVTSQAQAQSTCMIPPTQKEVVSGRFGKFRPGGAGNHGSAVQTPHIHSGLDFSTSGQSQPLYATTDGVVTVASFSQSAGNMVFIKRDNGDVVSYFHLAGFADGIKPGAKIRAGQQIGISGNTPATSMAKHLHFEYGTAQRDEARAKAFSEKAQLGPFDPAQLPSVVNQASGLGWRTDPAPYFCATFPIEDGHPEQYPILGRDTKAQHDILFGDVPDGGVAPNAQFDDVAVAAANMDAKAAQAAGQSPATRLSDSDGYGALPQPPLGEYDAMSPFEMLQTEGMRRFASAQWNTNLTQVSSRALWVDYNLAEGVSTRLDAEILRKKERINALLAALTAARSNRLSAEAQRNADVAGREEVNQIK
ncbi:M23 family metallopeptidase [Bordetella flabilis]